MRVSFAKDPQQGNVLKILEENHYYAFGMKHENYNVTRVDFKRYPDTGVELVPMPAVANASYNYKYNGKELQEELGLNMYDYGARNYDPALGRWMNIDPLAEKATDWTPYRYAFNNPLSFTDPTGMYEDWYMDEVSNDIEWHEGSGEREGFVNLGSAREITINNKYNFSLKSDGSFIEHDPVGDFKYGLGSVVERGGVTISHPLEINFSIKDGITFWGDDRAGDTSGQSGITKDSMESKNIANIGGTAPQMGVLSSLGKFFTGVKNFLFGASAADGVKTRVEKVVSTTQTAIQSQKKVQNDTLETLYYGGPQNKLLKTEKSVNGKVVKIE